MRQVLSLLLLSSILLFSCKKEAFIQEAPDNTIFPQTEKEKKTASVIKEVGKILETVYQDPHAVYEVSAAIFSGYYQDERVLIKDLLFPETSPLYKTEAFKKYKSKTGIFKEKFFKTLLEGEYPNLKEAMGINKQSKEIINGTPASGLSAAIPTDTNMEIYSNSNGIMIYFPYSENFGTTFTTAYFDNINDGIHGPKATIVGADREADSGPGREPYICGQRNDQYLCFRTVNVNDAYAELRATHIVGVGVEPLMDPPPPDPVPVTPVNRVYIGWTRIKKDNQLDKLISMTGNGGGSEMKICRISGYLQFADQQVVNFAGDIFTVHFTRKDIRKERWKRVYGVWDADWTPANLEQIFCTYEDDTKGSKKFTGSLTTTLNNRNPNPLQTYVGTIGFEVNVITQDELITQKKISRYSYFADALNNQGWGFVAEPNDFLPPGQDWPIYDAGTVWAFTWPYRVF